MRHFRNENGMTLMEIMAVVVVISITAALAAPSFFEILSDLQAKAQIQDIVFTLRKARSLAVATKQPHGMEFDYNQNAYIVFKEDSTGNTQLSSSKIGIDVLMCFDTFCSHEVLFQPDGSADQSGYVCIATDDYGNFYYLSILAATGKVRVEKALEYHPGAT